MKILDYEGLKQVVSKIKGLIDKKADKTDLEKFIENSKFLDTREKNENPEFYVKNYPQRIVREFKRTSVIGLSGKINNEYCYLITMLGWSNSSGGYPCQYCISSNRADVYYRVGIDSTSWSSWTRVLNESDLKLKLSQLTDDSTHRLVTDAEKTKWNNKAEKSYVDSAKTLTDALAKDLTENIDSINATKADKTALDNYVEKVSGKGLSTNDFTNDYKSKLDRINAENTDAGKIMKLAIETYNSMELWSSNNLYESLNGYYGLNLSSSIKTYEDFKRSDTAARAAANNSKVFKDMMEDEVVSSKMFGASGTRGAILENETSYKQLLSSPIARENMFTDKYWVRDIYKSAKNVELIESDTAYIRDLFEKCSYVYFLSVFESLHTKTGRFYLLGKGADTEVTNITPTPSISLDSLNETKDKIYLSKVRMRWEFNIEKGEYDKTSTTGYVYSWLSSLKNTLATSGSSIKELIILDLDMLEADIAKEQ